MDKKHTPPHRLQVIVLIINLSITVAIGLLLALLPETTSIGVRFAVLAVNIVALFSTLQFFIGQKFIETENRTKSLYEKISDLEKCVAISELYKRILMLDEEEREIHWDNLRDVETKFNKLIEERRSGGLARSVYYGKLHNAATKIKEDFKGKDKKKYKGEIWAMSFWQNDEWDKESNSSELGWITELEEMDKLGIKTVRIAVMSNKNKLLKGNINKEAENLINKIVDNCHDNRIRKNTTTLFVNDIAEDLEKTFGKGFFAIKLDGNNGKLSLIRGVSLDNLEALELEGELVFDPNNVKKTRIAWEQCRIAGQEAKDYFSRQYINGNISEEVKVEMEKRGLNWFEKKSTV